VLGSDVPAAQMILSLVKVLSGSYKIGASVPLERLELGERLACPSGKCKCSGVYVRMPYTYR